MEPMGTQMMLCRLKRIFLTSIFNLKAVWQFASVVLLIPATSCGGTWVDDGGNFKRVFGFGRPDDVRVVHSYYWKSPHFFAEYSYFIALQASQKFSSGLTAAQLMTPAPPDSALLESCGHKRPPWFLPKSLGSYDAWLPNAKAGYRVFRDKSDGTLFVCDQQL
jgi:hypothetical protein